MTLLSKLNQSALTLENEIEALMNTTKPLLDWSNEYHHLNHSLLNYGMPSYWQYFSQEATNQEKLCQMIQQAIEENIRHLQDVKVTIRELVEEEMTLYLSIEATGLQQAFYWESTVNLTRLSFKLL